MKILHTVQRYSPDVGGSEEVIKQVSEYLAAFGHEVTVATSATPARTTSGLNGVEIKEFSCSGNIVEGIKGDGKAFTDYVRSSNFDIMLNYAAQIWSTDLIFDILPVLTCKKVFVPCGYSRLRDPQFQSYYQKMPAILQQYDAVLYHSGSYIDKQFADEHKISNSIVIPNSTGLHDFQEVERGAFRKRHNLGTKVLVLNVSNHSWLKGHDFFWHCTPELKRLGCISVLIGNSYSSGPKKWLKECYSYCRYNAIMNGALNLEDYSRQHTIEAFTDADIFLFGSKVECAPLVMYEAFASKTLFITLDCGNVKDYQDIVCLVKSEGEAMEIIRNYVDHPDAYKDRVEKGYKLFLSELNWEAIARRYERLYSSLVAAGKIST
jgi:glycosyltransferase involved in cell wall biosynthesis